VAGAVASLILLALVDSRIAGALTALIGVAIAAYAVVRCFDIPNLGIRDLGQTAGQVRADTKLDGGPFLALTGGILLALGSLADLLPAREQPEGTAIPAGRSVLGRRRAARPARRPAAR